MKTENKKANINSKHIFILETLNFLFRAAKKEPLFNYHVILNSHEKLLYTYLEHKIKSDVKLDLKTKNDLIQGIYDTDFCKHFTLPLLYKENLKGETIDVLMLKPIEYINDNLLSQFYRRFKDDQIKIEDVCFTVRSNRLTRSDVYTTFTKFIDPEFSKYSPLYLNRIKEYTNVSKLSCNIPEKCEYKTYAFYRTDQEIIKVNGSNYIETTYPIVTELIKISEIEKKFGCGIRDLAIGMFLDIPKTEKTFYLSTISWVEKSITNFLKEDGTFLYSENLKISNLYDQLHNTKKYFIDDDGNIYTINGKIIKSPIKKLWYKLFH